MIWLVVVVVVILFVVVVTMVRKDDPFQVAATDLGLKLTRTVPDLLPRLDGMVEGIAVKVDVVAQREPVLRYRAFYPALGMALRLERETTISRTLGQLGSGDQQLGAKPFDDSFRIDTSRPDALQAMMTPELRRTLIGLIERHPQAVIADGEITVTQDNLEPLAETVIATVKEMAVAAQALVAARPPALEPPPVRPAAGTVRPPAAAPTQAPPTPEPTSEPPAGQPAPPEATPLPDETPEPPLEPESKPEPTTGLPANFFDDVFGANRLSFEEDDTFEREVRGRNVTLSGTIKQASAYAGDEDLSPAVGSKAIVRVAQIETDLYGKSDIDAVVYLNDVATADLQRGDTVEFSGTLEKVDPFMRNLFVVNATMTT